MKGPCSKEIKIIILGIYVEQLLNKFINFSNDCGTLQFSDYHKFSGLEKYGFVGEKSNTSH